MERVFCTNCGAENDSGKKFCTNCGAPLDKSFLEDGQSPAQGEPSTAYDEASFEVADEIGSDAGFFVSEDVASDETRYMPASSPAPAPSPAPEPMPENPRKHTSTGKIVGITLGIVAAVCVVGFGLFYFLNPLGLTTGIFENSAAAQAQAAAEAEEKAAQAEADAEAKQAELDKAEEEAQQKQKELDEAKKAQEEAEKAQKEAEEEARRAQSSSSSSTNGSTSGVYVGSNGIEYTHHLKKTNSTDYILPQSDTRTYSNSELEALSNYELYLARNEIFARYGRKYSEESLSNYLNGTDWYTPLYDGSEFDEVLIEDYMNEHEYKNIIQMLDIERDRESEYLSY